MKRIERTSILATMIAGVDLGIKEYIEKSVVGAEEKAYLKGRVKVRKVHNKGFAYNLLDEKPKLVKAGSCMMLLLCLCMDHLMKKESKLDEAASAMVIGGALSNTYDRVKKGYVVDYIGFQEGNYTYNLADFFIIIGVSILMIKELIRELLKK